MLGSTAGTPTDVDLDSSQANRCDEIVLLTSGMSVAYLFEHDGVDFQLSATPFESPELTLRAVDTDSNDRTLTVDQFDEEFLSDSLAVERAARNTTRIIEHETGTSLEYETVENVFGRIKDDLASGEVVVVDEWTRDIFQKISAVYYTGNKQPWTIQLGPVNYNRMLSQFVRSLTSLRPEVMGEGGPQPPNFFNTNFGRPESPHPQRWERLRRALIQIATVGEAPDRAVDLDVTDPDHIDRLPSSVICGVTYDELTEIAENADELKGGPDSVEGVLRTEFGSSRPSKSKVKQFVIENGLDDGLSDVSP